MRYRPDLDGIRAVAVLAVMASHTGMPLTGGGWLGVDVFFVLSGYLITRLLLREREAAGAVSLRAFYVRRMLRLYPALLLVLLVGALFYRELGDGGTRLGYARTALVSGLYLEDFFQGFGYSLGGFGHTWSLAVEEQFYLVWPPVLLLAFRRGRDPLRWAALATAVAWGIGAACSFQSSTDGVSHAAYYLPWSRFSQILAGCALAILIDRGAQAPRPLRAGVSGGLTAAGALVALVMIAGRVGRVGHFAWEAPVAAVLTCAVIWHLSANPASGLRRVLGVAPLAWVGRRSYGIYLIHAPVLGILVSQTDLTRSEDAMAMGVATLLLAAVSYRFVELPFLRLKHRFERVGEIPTGMDGCLAGSLPTE